MNAVPELHANEPYDLRQSRRLYDRLSSHCDRLTARFEGVIRQRAIQLFAPEQSEHILEIGSGTGSNLIDMARQREGQTAKLRGLDASFGMHRVARRQFVDEQIDQQIDLQLGDARRLPFRDRTFDLVVMIFTLELFEASIPSVLDECHRVLTTGGRLAVASMAEASLEPPSPTYRIYGWLHDRFPQWIDCRPIASATLIEHRGFALDSRVDTRIAGLPVTLLTAVKQAEPDLPSPPIS